VRYRPEDRTRTYCSLSRALLLALAVCLVSAPAAWSKTAGPDPVPTDQPPITIGFFPLHATTTESAADVNLVENALRTALQEATAQRPTVEVVFLDSQSSQIRDLVAKGIITQEAVGRDMSLEDMGAVVRSLGLKAAVIPRLDRMTTKEAHPSFQVVFQTLLPQSGRTEDLTVPGTVQPAFLGTSKEFEAGVRQLTIKLVSTSLPALVETISTDKSHDQNAAAQAFKLAQDKVAAGDFEKAAQLLQQVVFLVPDKAEYALLLGDVNLHLNRPGAAADAFRSAVQSSPDSVIARSKYADCLVQLSRFSEAEKQLQIAQNLQPQDPSVVVALASVFLRQKDYEKALALLESAAKKIEDATLNTQLGDVYRLLKRPDAAEAAYRHALELGASPELCYQRLAHLFAKRNDYCKSFHFLAQAAGQWPGPKPFSPDEVKDYLKMTNTAVAQVLNDSREEIIKFTQMQQSRVSLFQRLSSLRQEALDISSFLERVEAPQPYLDITSQWQAISTLVGQIVLDHLIHVDTNDTSYNLVANDLRVRANAEIANAQKELEKTH
jgi:tetratricopeptide (TPR) repeat protein